MSEPSVKPACHCASLEKGYRGGYILTPAAMATIVDHISIEGPWEYIQKCTLCGQLWHNETVSSGHANIETTYKIGEDEVKPILAKAEAARRAVEKWNRSQAENPEPSNSEQSWSPEPQPLWERVVANILIFAIGGVVLLALLGLAWGMISG
jgi:hypothetical protein